MNIKKLGLILITTFISIFLSIGLAGFCYGEEKNEPSGPPSGYKFLSTQQPPIHVGLMESEREFGEKLDLLVTIKFITESQKNSIREYVAPFFKKRTQMNPSQTAMTQKKFDTDEKDPLGFLVKNKVVTQEQADVIGRLLLAKGDFEKDKFQNQYPPQSPPPGHFKCQKDHPMPSPTSPPSLSGRMPVVKDIQLTVAKVINEKQKDIILQSFNKFMKTNEGPEPERMKGINKHIEKFEKDLLISLVKKGELKEEQAKIIEQIFAMSPRPI